MCKVKDRKCTECKILYAPKVYNLKVMKQCSKECIKIYADKIRGKEFKKDTALMRAANQDNDIKYQHKQCKKVFNRLRKLQELKWFFDRRLEPVCISCSLPKGNDIWANGHFKQYGTAYILRYDTKNSYLQHNKRCNSALAGNISGTATTHGYKQGLLNRFGEAEGLAIIEYCDILSSSKERHTCEQLIVMRKGWNVEIRKLEKELNEF